MTNEVSSPALIPGTIPEGLLPPIICGKSVQEVYQELLSITGVALAAGQRGPTGPTGPAGPSATIKYVTVDVTLGNGIQNNVFTLATAEHPSHFTWTLTDPSDSGTALVPAPAIGYFSQTGTANQWRVTFTAPLPNDGWVLTRTKVTT